MVGTPDVVAAALECAAAHDADAHAQSTGRCGKGQETHVVLDSLYAANRATVDLLLVLARQARAEWDPDLAYHLLSAAYVAVCNVEEHDGGPVTQQCYTNVVTVAYDVVRTIDTEECYADMLNRTSRAAFVRLAQSVQGTARYFAERSA